MEVKTKQQAVDVVFDDTFTVELIKSDCNILEQNMRTNLERVKNLARF
jgi:hypothetical protein